MGQKKTPSSYTSLLQQSGQNNDIVDEANVDEAAPDSTNAQTNLDEHIIYAAELLRKDGQMPP